MGFDVDSTLGYTFSGTSAGAFFGAFKEGPPQPSFSVFVNSGLNSFEAENSDGSATVMQSTMVQFSQFDSTGTGGFGCFIIPPGDFRDSIGGKATGTTSTLVGRFPTSLADVSSQQGQL